MSMGTGAIAITNGQLAASASLILLNIVLSTGLRLGLGRSLLLASGRMVVQLLLIGQVLQWLFLQQNPGLILALSLLMALMASLAAVHRTRHRFAGIYWQSFLSITASAALVTGLAMAGIIRVQPWTTAQYWIPLLGMVLGNTLNAISLGLDTLMERMLSQRAILECALSLGASRWEACRPQVREAIRVAMIPTINSMMVMGLVSLPGMMTGQILEGALPSAAVRYQIVILFMIASATALGVTAIVTLAYLHLTSPQHHLRLDRLQRLDQPSRKRMLQGKG